ncbi:MAG: aldehyde dehydrogenase family protein [Burkholderiaceae bacterium]|nr:aldehyde dehydrogenase family protein [Burkholderiaceae bacterium]
MSDIAAFIRDHQLDAMRLAGRKVGAGRDRCIEVFNPYSEELLGTIPKATLEEVRRAYEQAHAYHPTLTRFERAAILNRTAALALCMKDAVYEAGRVSDVLLFGAQEVLKDDGQIFSCDLTHHGKQRRVYTQRSPLLGVITAITPFNHPMNQVAHKVIPSVATNNRMVLKPSEKVPFSAIYFADLLYEAGLPPEMLQVITGDPREIADEMLTHPAVDLITFTGGVPIGKYIASKAGYRRVVLELGGNDPLIVMDDADLEEASNLAVQGSYKNSGQRSRVNEAVAQGARLLVGNQRRGALYSPTVIDQVRPEMTVVREETFGPVSPIIRFSSMDEAIQIANGTPYGLSSGVCTNRMDDIVRFVNELQMGTVNVREVPGYRLELTPFGGIKDSGLGYKEGVQEAMKSFTNIKTYSIPWL